MLKVLGISFGFHDSAASIVVDGKFIVGSEEERFSRLKHDSGFPENAVKFCLDKAALSIDDIVTLP